MAGLKTAARLLITLLLAATLRVAVAQTVSGSLRSRVEAWQWFEGDADSAYGYPGTILRLSVGQQRQKFDWQVELAAPVLLGLPDGAIAPGAQGQLGLGGTYFAANNRSRNAGSVFVKQAFLRSKNLGGSEAHSVRLGRFEFVEGTEVTPRHPTLAAVKRDRIAHRLLGHFGWSHVGRSVDGLHYVWDRPTTNVTVVGARPTRGVFQTDGWGPLDAAFLYAALTRPGGFRKGAAEWRLFGLHYHDWRDVVKTDNRPLVARRADRGNVRVATAGGHYLRACETAAGAFDALFWGVLQGGRWGALVHRAGAAAAEGGWQPAVWKRLKPWIRAGYFHGAGDQDPADERHHTFFQVLPTPRWYARFPFYNLMNNEDRFVALILRPHQRLSLRSEAHSLRLAESNDLWYQGGGAFQPWTFGYAGRPAGGNRGLATMFDVSADYQVNSRLSVGSYFAHAQGKLVPSSIYPAGKNARFGYLEFGYRF